jgi:HEAT repeat protein
MSSDRLNGYLHLMVRSHPYLKLSFLLSVVFLLAALVACDTGPTTTATPVIYVEESLVTDRPVTDANVLPLLRLGIPTERIAAALALYQYDVDPEEAIPILVENLEYDGPRQVRETAAVALGRMGPTAEAAIPKLIQVLQQDDSIQVRWAAAWALGEIGHSSAVPYLAEQLYYGGDRYERVRGASRESAEALEKILNADFTDEPDGSIGPGDVLVIVIEARQWWEEEGQYREWPPMPSVEPDNS